MCGGNRLTPTYGKSILQFALCGRDVRMQGLERCLGRKEGGWGLLLMSETEKRVQPSQRWCVTGWSLGHIPVPVGV